VARLNKRNTVKTAKREKVEDPRLSPDTVVTDHPAAGKYGDVFALNDVDGFCPVSGNSYYIYLDQSKDKVTLLHPFSLAKFTMDVAAFLNCRTQNDWNPTPAKLAGFLNQKVKLQKSLGRLVENYLLLLVKHYETLAEESI
jgi:hypothetical protein